MSQIEDIHGKINEQFVANLKSKQIDPAMAAELLGMLSEGTCAKPEQLIDFYRRKLPEGPSKCSKSKN